MPVEYQGQSSGFVINACVSELRSQWQWQYRGVQFTAQWSGKCAQWTVHSGLCTVDSGVYTVVNVHSGSRVDWKCVPWSAVVELQIGTAELTMWFSNCTSLEIHSSMVHLPSFLWNMLFLWKAVSLKYILSLKCVLSLKYSFFQMCSFFRMCFLWNKLVNNVVSLNTFTKYSEKRTDSTLTLFNRSVNCEQMQKDDVQCSCVLADAELNFLKRYLKPSDKQLLYTNYCLQPVANVTVFVFT